MSSLPSWAHLSIIAGAVLFSPVLAFLGFIAVEIVIGVLVDAGGLTMPVFVAGVIGGLLLRTPRGPRRSRRVHASFLFLVLIIRIVDREKAPLGAVWDLAIFATESRAPGVVQVISVCDPAHDIEPPAGCERPDFISL